MLSPFVLQRLSELNLSQTTNSQAAEGAFVARHGPAPANVSAPSAAFRRSAGEPSLAGCEVEGPYGPHWQWERSVRSLWPALDRCWEPEASRRAIESRAAEYPELRALARSFPQSALFLDLETCGFAGCAIFLIGVAQWREELLLTQLLARNYAEEQAVLASLWQLVIGKQVLVTFNGKSFDWPMVEDRTTLHRLPRPAGLRWTHCDLLHHARRRWKDQLPDCRLQTLERFICRRHRIGDVAGHEAPAAYHEYVRTADPRAIHGVLEHNALDLITLLELTRVLTTDDSC